MKYSIDRTKKLNLGVAYLWAPAKEMQVVDDSTVKMILSYPVALEPRGIGAGRGRRHEL